MEMNGGNDAVGMDGGGGGGGEGEKQHEQQKHQNQQEQQIENSAPQTPRNNAVPLVGGGVTEQAGELEPEPEYLKGFRLHMLTVGIWIALFLSTLETTITSTSLVAIADSLSGFEVRNWVVTSYFLTYTGFLIIYAKLASIFGNKTMLLLALTIFTAFSLACGSVNSMTQLIVLRAFQGMGASGIYSMILVIASQMVPPAEYGKYVGIISSVFVISSILGPIIGGAISSGTTWRWVFLLNGPPGVLSIVIVAIFLPASKVDSNTTFAMRLRAKFARETVQRVDVLGAFSLLAASMLLVFALEEGGSRYPWDSGAIISTLVLSGVLWVFFVAWEIYLEKTRAVQEPIFPMGLLKNRLISSMMFATMFIGFPFVTILFTIPQFGQAVYELEPIPAALSILPLLLSSPAAIVISGVLTSNYNVAPAHLIIVGSVIQMVGVGLTIDIPLAGSQTSAKQYGFETIMGLGFGMTLGTVLTLAQLISSKEDVGVVMGALTQIRVLGGTVSLAICSAILSNHLKQELVEVITPAQFSAIAETLGSIDTLDPEQVAKVRFAFATGYHTQFKILAAFSGAALFAALFLISRHPITVREAAKKEASEQPARPPSHGENVV